MMYTPDLSTRPARPGFPRSGGRTVELITTLTLPAPVLDQERPPVSLALVLDRSGSMQGQKMAHARAGASQALALLSGEDRASVTVFDNVVDVLQPLTRADGLATVHAKIALVEARANTNLHGGWSAGAATLSGAEEEGRPRRVILLTDGLANDGVTDPGAIAAAVAEAARRGIATSTLGVGEDYNEDLLEALARAGDGSYYYVEQADQLKGLFEAELRGFKALVGREVTLSIQAGAGVEVVEVLNDFLASASGVPAMPNLLAGGTQTVGFVLRALPGFAGARDATAEVAWLVLTWTDVETGQRREVRHTVTLPVVEAPEFDRLPAQAEVAEAVALLQSARAKREATRSVDRGDESATRDALVRARRAFDGLVVSSAIERELSSLSSLEKDLDEGKFARLRKNAHYESYSRSHSMDEAGLAVHINRKMVFIAARKIDVVRGDLADQKVDVIFNSHSGNAGLDGHLRSKGGATYRAECEALGTLAPGQVAVTSGGRLKAAKVVHASVPNWRDGQSGEIEALEAIYREAFRLARDQGAQKVAIPVLGSGARGYPFKVAVPVALFAAARFIMGQGSGAQVTFVVPRANVAEAVRDLVQRGGLV